MNIRKRLFLFFTIWCTTIAFAVPPDYLPYAQKQLDLNKKSVTRYIAPKPENGREIIFLETPFASPYFRNIADASKLKGRIIEHVDYVYTRYRQSEDFSQINLNKQRLQQLRRILPDAFSAPFTEWQTVEQTGAASPDEGRTYFHGFVIIVRKEVDEDLSMEELKGMDSLFAILKGTTVKDPASTGTTTSSGYPGMEKKIMLSHEGGTSIIIDRDFPEDSLRFVLKPSTDGASVIQAKWSDTAHKSVIVTEMFQGHKRKRVWSLEEHRADPSASTTYNKLDLLNPDSVILTTLRRNKFNNYIIVCDVTGSMQPYTAQLFASITNIPDPEHCKGFVFFNDGDNKRDGLKINGKTGGVYSTTSMRSDSVFYTARYTMSKGTGGDRAENNLEAILYASRMNPDAEIVLIADNWASPRDLELIEKINKPVHVVLCGARSGVNIDYLYLARKTHGSVHTVQGDYYNLDQLKEGDIIKIGHQEFLLHNDGFVLFM